MDVYENLERQKYPIAGEILLYTVKRGDNLYRIAKTLNTQLNWILAMNNLNRNSMIFPNQQLLIPVLFQAPPAPLPPRPPLGPKPPMVPPMPRDMSEERNEFDMYF